MYTSYVWNHVWESTCLLYHRREFFEVYMNSSILWVYIFHVFMFRHIKFPLLVHWSRGFLKLLFLAPALSVVTEGAFPVEQDLRPVHFLFSFVSGIQYCIRGTRPYEKRTKHKCPYRDFHRSVVVWDLDTTSFLSWLDVPPSYLFHTSTPTLPPPLVFRPSGRTPTPK